MLDEKLQEYAKRFKEGFPMIPLAWGKSDKEVEGIVQKCIDKGKTAYELGLVKDDSDDMY